MKTNDLLIQSYLFYKLAFHKFAFIKRLPNGKYRVLSQTGRNLGTYNTKNKAKARLRQIEMFKHIKKASAEINLKDIEELSYSSIMRKLVKIDNKDIINKFQKMFKKNFDASFLDKEKDPQEKALYKTLSDMNEDHSMILPKKFLEEIKK